MSGCWPEGLLHLSDQTEAIGGSKTPGGSSMHVSLQDMHALHKILTK